VTELLPTTAVATGPSVKPLLIDVDAHEMMTSKSDLAPYMSGHWRKVVDTYYFDKFPVAPNGSWQVTAPSTGARNEWLVSADDAPAGSGAASGAGTSVDVMRQHLFEDEGVSHVILNGLFYPNCYPAHFEFAAALASAYNDWQIDNWLERDPRIYGRCTSWQPIRRRPRARSIASRSIHASSRC
jgi:hypothetical protein